MRWDDIFDGEITEEEARAETIRFSKSPKFYVVAKVADRPDPCGGMSWDDIREYDGSPYWDIAEVDPDDIEFDIDNGEWDADPFGEDEYHDIESDQILFNDETEATCYMYEQLLKETKAEIKDLQNQCKKWENYIKKNKQE